jgi:hypothetical protein
MMRVARNQTVHRYARQPASRLGRPGVRAGAVLMAALACVSTALAQTTSGGEASAELARKLSNPVASLISVPFQLNWDHGIGPDEDGRRFLMNFQPVMPFHLNDDWNLIARVIVPIVGQPVLFEGGDPSFGMGDLLVSGFFSPAKGGVTWGVGPVAGLPVTSDPTLGSGRYTLGPTAVVLKQAGHWTVGALVNQLWSVGGDAGREDVNQTFLQPFVAYGKSGWTFSLNTESAANWKADSGEEWTVPINLTVSKVLLLGKRPISVQAGPRLYVAQPTGGPKWGFRAGLTLIFPAG